MPIGKNWGRTAKGFARYGGFRLEWMLDQLLHKTGRINARSHSAGALFANLTRNPIIVNLIRPLRFPLTS
jgi:hypothetical protein